MTQGTKYIWQYPAWPKFYWNDSAILKTLGQCRFKQGSLLAKMKGLGLEVKQQARAEVLIEETLKTSEIEGEFLDAKAVRSSVARRLGLPTAGLMVARNQHADGVIDILLDATNAEGEEHRKKLTAERLFSWHAALFPTGYSGLHKIHVAGWRDDQAGPMQVVSGAIGREKIHYQAPPATAIAGEIDHFLYWWRVSSDNVDGLLRAAIAHLWFVAIHPFEDGNGRIARTLTEMALAEDENMHTRYYSLSSQIMKEREGYYALLDSTNRGAGYITEWLLWFLECLSRAIEASDLLLNNVLQKARFWARHAQTELSDRQCKVINRMLEAGVEGFEGGLTNRKYAGLAHVSRATAQRELADLVQKNVLLVNPSGGRSVSYSLGVES
jgi:Fic family protein